MMTGQHYCLFCLVVSVDKLTFTLSFLPGLGPSLPPRLGGLHRQPLQRHAHTRDIVLTAIFCAVAEEETAAQLRVGRVSVETGQ